jgi:hypothetical protein
MSSLNDFVSTALAWLALTASAIKERSMDHQQLPKSAGNQGIKKDIEEQR